MLAHRRLVPALVLVPAAAFAAGEPDLRLHAQGSDVRVEILPSAALPLPQDWNLYRGALADVAGSLQAGDPDGRCAVAGDATEIVLAGERDVPGNHYYLLTAVSDTGVETGLGTRSDGIERVNGSPCPRLVPCGTEVLPLTGIRGTEGLAIGPDGTAYYSQSGAVGRRLPGGAPENRWALLPGTTTVWGMALRADGMLFVGTPGAAGGSIWRIDTTSAVPAPVVHYAAAGSANGVIVAPDGAVIYSDFNGDRVYRVDEAGVRTQVTMSNIDAANGLLIDDDGTLLVLAYSSGQIWRLTLDASWVETGRVLAGTVTGARLDGIAKDETGRYYLGDNGGGRLLRTDSAFGSQEVLVTGVNAAANIAFGKGALDCTDLYVASSGNLGFYEAGVAGRP